MHDVGTEMSGRDCEFGREMLIPWWDMLEGSQIELGLRGACG
jgi:hypothetical protein